MMFIYAIKDDCSQTFQQLMPAKEVSLVRRGLVNVVNSGNKQNLMVTNPEDFSLYQLGTLDELTGEITSDLKFELRLSDLVKHDAN